MMSGNRPRDDAGGSAAAITAWQSAPNVSSGSCIEYLEPLLQLGPASNIRIMTTRRHFVASLPALLLVAARRPEIVAPTIGDHPTPRPGITAAKVLTKDQLGEHGDAAPVFDMVREIPQIVDGIRCQCGCSALNGKYSLLSCFEADGMASHCQICQGEARLVYRLNKQGKSLDDIRAAIDAKFG
jgi:hypothetical protein